ncbi:hypothetical protein EJP69_19160 [Variovorax gossypii]|uniref:Uncharacterized protein n=1 Tax=Variovorax gossypii TaxID=1679495 RepID=A0A431TJ80_9BURK|nr:hypothetical protein [Variovorax gossypii]RTQ32835.1 hypothetical protein EJP69_19160 [Variovorax gossypii]
MAHPRNALPLWLLLAAAPCPAAGIEDMRSHGSTQGLYEIRERARAFVAQHNAKGGVIWHAGEPNLKVFVPRCAVALDARWDTIRWSSTDARGAVIPQSRRVIAVRCARTVDPPQQWDVHVPVTTNGSAPRER